MARPTGRAPSTRACWGRCLIRSALSHLATRYSTRSLQITRNSLGRALRHAESNDLVGRNVAALVKTPQGRNGRASKSFAQERSEEHTSELQSQSNLVCRLLLEKKKKEE